MLLQRALTEPGILWLPAPPENHFDSNQICISSNLGKSLSVSRVSNKIIFDAKLSGWFLQSLPLKSQLRSYHLSVMVSNQSARPERRYVSFRDVREHRKLDLQHKLLAPVITKLFNRSLQDQCVSWKLANLTPIPKESPLTNCNQLRPISFTNILTRLFEKLILKFELSDVFKSLIGPDQFAYKENSSTTMALVKSQHYWLKWLDRNADFVRVLSFDFSIRCCSSLHPL